MRKLSFIMLLSLLLISKVNSQTSSPTVFPHAFIVDNRVENGKIQVAQGGGAHISGNLSINIQNIIDSYNFAETSIAVMNGTNVLLSVDGPTFSKSSDFYNNSYISNAKNFSISIPSSIIHEVTNGANLQLVVRYKFTVIGNSTWIPRIDEQIGEYYVGKDKYGFGLSILPTTIVGPDLICDEGIYTIGNPKDISLKNANGIASLTTTGTGEYKIQRVGTSSGLIELVSSSSSTNSSKKIIVGSPAPSIMGNETIYGNGEYYYTIKKSDPSSTLNLSLPGSGRAPYKIEETTSGTIRIITNTVNSGANDYLIIIKASETNSCGTSTITEKKIILRGGGGAS